MMKMSRKGDYDVESSDNEQIEDEDDLLPKGNRKGVWDKLRRRLRVKRLDRRERLCLLVGLIIIAVVAVLFVIIGVAVGEKESNSDKNGGNSQAPVASSIWNEVILPSSITPMHYNITLQPDMETFRVNGTSVIEATVNEETDYILLHAKSMTIGSFTVKNYAVKRSFYYEENDFFVVQLTTPLSKGPVVMHVMYNYTLATGLAGFYKSSYTLPNGDKEVLATTQFEATDARRAFPCFDEPAMKANFTISIVHSREYNAMSNMPIDSVEGVNERWTCTKFKTTVRMSSYLVAFVVSKFVSRNSSFTSRSGEEVVVRAWSRKDAYNQTEFALGVAVDVLRYYEEFFDIPYPLPKQDLFAIPDFAVGAMENWGLITYRETAILYDPESTSSHGKQVVATIVSHELAHQWFGNLVTMAWWDGLWLNEGFASYVEYIGTDHDQPDWNMMDQFVVRDLWNALTLDSLNSSHPIISGATDPDEISALFDSISYDKGSTILRMLRNFMGESFLNGIKAYLRQHKYHNANTSELWSALDQAYCTSGRSCDRTINDMMDTWTKQTGYPLLTISRSSANLLTIKQDRFFAVPHKDTDFIPPSPYNYQWKVPFTYITSSSGDPSKKLITKKTDQSIQLDPAVSWVKANAGQTGLYRVNYDVSDWIQFVTMLRNDHTVLPASDRAGLIDDAFSIASAGKLDIEIALNMTHYLSDEQDYLPWISALHWISKMSSLLSLNPVYGMYEQHVRELLEPIIERVGWSTDNSTHLNTFLRSAVLSAGWRFGHTDTIDTAVDMFHAWMNGSIPSIHPDLKSVVYSAGIAFGDVEQWDYLWNIYQTTNDTAEKSICLAALAYARTPWLLTRYLHYSFTDAVRSQDTLSVVRSVSGNIYGRSITWNFLRNNWATLKDRYGSGAFSFGRMIRTVSSAFSTQLELEEFKEFFNQHSDAGSGTRSYLQAEEAIMGNIYWLEHNLPAVISWLNKQTNHK